MTPHTPTQNLPTYLNRPIPIDADRAAHWHDLELDDDGIEDLRYYRTHSQHAIDRLVELWTELADEHHRGTPIHKALPQFVQQATNHADALERLAMIHTIEELGERRRGRGQHKDRLSALPWQGWIDPEDPHRRKRVLTELEMSLVRLAARNRHRQSIAVVAIGEAGAAVGELPLITAAHYDIETTEILLPGGIDDLAERASTIAYWAVAELEHIATDHAGGDDCMLYRGQATHLRGVQSSLAMLTKKIFDRAGIGGDPSVSFGSLRHTTARSILDSAGTDAAVTFLGETNYELVRTKLGLRPAPPQRRRRNAA